MDVAVNSLLVGVGAGIVQGIGVGLEDDAFEHLLDFTEEDISTAADEVAVVAIGLQGEAIEALDGGGETEDVVAGSAVNEDTGELLTEELGVDLLVSDNGSGGRERNVHVVYTLWAGGSASAFSNKTHVWSSYCAGVKLFFVYPWMGASRARADWGVCLCPVGSGLRARPGSACRVVCHMDGYRTGAGRLESQQKTLNVWPRCHQNQGGWVAANDFGFDVEAFCITYNPLAT